ncbi:hypothetical protein vecB_078 [Escherichia phage VEcB]|uniref:Uncharacterized protein n=1 Tax=Escherichia phage VEcB TaxID=2776821 RepID=A0A7L8ZGE7_9CAUD|nr:hypothetical protein JR328_gp078 [Escherichia phage VEcB]QOI68016.1 hypothetical protein vecB_078 [Escherichia phage VEcB]
MTTALDIQIDGDHYKRMRMQPLELAYLIGATPCFTKLAKYACRNKGDRMINLNKAIHVIHIEKELSDKYYNMLYEAYPNLKNPVKIELANQLIDLYTDDDLVRKALKAMYKGKYIEAADAIETLKESVDGFSR